MERITLEKDFLFAALIALAIHIGIAFTHMSTSPRPLHFKAKNYGRLNISMVSTRTADVVPVVKKERKIVVKGKKEIIKPDKQISPIQRKEIITEPVSTEKIETRPAGPSADAVFPPSAPTGKESLETAKVTMAVPRYDENVPPIYPAIARKRGYEGVVLLSAEILIDGRVGELKIKKSSGYHILDRSALKAVKKWKFEPARRMGYPTVMWVEVPVKYVLRDR